MRLNVARHANRLRIVKAVLDRAMGTEVHDHSVWPPSDEAMYVAITRAWCRLGSFDERRRHPLGPYVLGPWFVPSVVEAFVDVRVVAVVCAKVASRFPWAPGSGEPTPLPGSPWGWLDPLFTWWRAFGDRDRLGVHYGELVGGALEFLSVGGRDERPLGLGFASE